MNTQIQTRYDKEIKVIGSGISKLENILHRCFKGELSSQEAKGEAIKCATEIDTANYVAEKYEKEELIVRNEFRQFAHERYLGAKDLFNKVIAIKEINSTHTSKDL